MFQAKAFLNCGKSSLENQNLYMMRYIGNTLKIKDVIQRSKKLQTTKD